VSGAAAGGKSCGAAAGGGKGSGAAGGGGDAASGAAAGRARQRGGVVLLGVGGGIAAFKAAALASRLVQRGVDVRVAMTRGATRFIGALTFEGLTGRPVAVSATQVDADGAVPHIEAARRADLMVVAPATAGLLARLAAGVCDDAVTLAAVACRCPRLLCPAMNDAMWQDAIVQRNAATLAAHGFELLGPVEGHLAEGYDAIGRMVEPEQICDEVERRLAARPPS
jgi:phosphopantothenoylcysteine decarboxylase/phosphopantothenate--cysteine ligase